LVKPNDQQRRVDYPKTGSVKVRNYNVKNWDRILKLAR
jgi:hypothetical protein